MSLEAGYLEISSACRILDTRSKYLDGFGYKLNDAEGYGLDVALPNELEIDENAMSITFPFADGRHRDGVGDLLEVGGIQVDRHITNPVVLFDHGKEVKLPIGKAEDPNTKAYTVFLDQVNQVALCKAFFYQSHKDTAHALFCEQLFDMMVKRYVRAGSIGFTVIRAKEIPPNFETGTPKGLHLYAIKMLEASAVVMPANQDTVRKALSLHRVCGKPLSPMLVKSLTPYAGEKKVVVAVPLNEDLSRTNVPPARWRPGVGAMKGKDISELRNKYKNTKNLRRRLKKSTPGSSMVYLNGKDLKAAKQFAESRGVKFTRVGVKGDLEKVKLSGDDESIDAVAKQFGRSIKGTSNMAVKNAKLVETKNTRLVNPAKVKNKALEDEPDMTDTPDVPTDDDVMLEDDGIDVPQEKYSAQAARRVYEDLRVLMADYDRMAGPLENDDFSAYFQETLELVEDRMSTLETLWGKHHGDLPGLDGAPTKSEDGGGEDLDVDEMAEDDKDIDDDSTNAVPVDSVDDEPEDDTTDEESAEVMMNKMLKNLDKTREKYKKKAMCKDCGKAGCKCKALPKKKGLEKEEEGHKALTEDEVQDIKEDIDVQSEDTEDNPAPHPEMNSDDKGLKDHEVPKAQEAHQYLKELSETRNYDDEMRMKSYHFHKSLDAMGGLGEEESADPMMHKSNDMPAMEDAIDPTSTGMKLHPHRKMCKDVGGFFRRISFEKAFGDPHRQEALVHHKNMDEMLGSYCKQEEPPVDPEGEVPQEADTPEVAVGDVQEKKLNQLESLLTRLETLV